VSLKDNRAAQGSFKTAGGAAWRRAAKNAGDPLGGCRAYRSEKSPEGFSSNDRSSVVDISRPSDFYFWVLSMGDFRAILRRVVVDFPALRGLQAINGQIVLPRLSRRRKLLSKI
jgi:hypothetical protein